MSITALILIYVALLLGALYILELFSELRRRRFGPTHTEDRIFRCQKCGYVYTDDADMTARAAHNAATERADCVLKSHLLRVVKNRIHENQTHLVVCNKTQTPLSRAGDSGGMASGLMPHSSGSNRFVATFGVGNCLSSRRLRFDDCSSFGDTN